ESGDKAWMRARASVLLPAPRSPQSATTSPGRRIGAKATAKAAVAAGSGSWYWNRVSVAGARVMAAAFTGPGPEDQCEGKAKARKIKVTGLMIEAWSCRAPGFLSQSPEILTVLAFPPDRRLICRMLHGRMPPNRNAQ